MSSGSPTPKSKVLFRGGFIASALARLIFQIINNIFFAKFFPPIVSEKDFEYRFIIISSLFLMNRYFYIFYILTLIKSNSKAFLFDNLS